MVTEMTPLLHMIHIFHGGTDDEFGSQWDLADDTNNTYQRHLVLKEPNND